MPITKEECLNLGKSYIIKYNCYPAAKGWTKSSAGCSRDAIYKNWDSWQAFVLELNTVIEIPKTPCVTAAIKSNPKSKPCKICNKLTYFRNIYCSNACQGVDRQRETIRKFLAGEYIGKNINSGLNSWLRNYLISIKGEYCESCGIGSIYNNKPLVLEIDHIDGRCFNNILDNLRFLCPNCHSQTDTFKAKNPISDNRDRYNKN